MYIVAQAYAKYFRRYYFAYCLIIVIPKYKENL